MKKRSFFTIVILISFILLGIYKETDFINNIDRGILSSIQGIFPSKLILPDLITSIGNPATYFILTPIFLIIFMREEDRSGAKTILISVLISTILMLSFKNIFKLERPTDFMRIDQNGYTYPSGHALVSSGVYFTIYRIRKFKKPYKYFFLLPILIGLTRLILGVHYPSDVLMGILLGLVVSSWSIYYYEENFSINKITFSKQK